MAENRSSASSSRTADPDATDGRPRRALSRVPNPRRAFVDKDKNVSSVSEDPKPQSSVAGADNGAISSLTSDSSKLSIASGARDTRRTRSSVSNADDPPPVSWLSLATRFFGDTKVSSVTANMLFTEACKNKELLDFHGYLRILEQGKIKAEKIGEGTFGEVFRFSYHDGSQKVIKIVPVDGDFVINAVKPKPSTEVAEEIVITGLLSELRSGEINRCSAFASLLNVANFRGAYPERLRKLWDEFSKETGTLNEKPKGLPRNSRFIAMEMAHVGCDLEKFSWKDASQAASVLLQVAAALATAELAYQFEHRDLHCGNVLVEETKEGEDTEEVFVLGGVEQAIPNRGVRASLIDFGLSRLQIPQGAVIFNDLSRDPALFENAGKDDDELQRGVYRQMKDVCNNKWDAYCPKTNVLWLEYLRHVLYYDVRYTGNTGSEEHKSGKTKLHRYKKILENSQSAYDFVRKIFDPSANPSTLRC